MKKQAIKHYKHCEPCRNIRVQTNWWNQTNDPSDSQSASGNWWCRAGSATPLSFSTTHNGETHARRHVCAANNVLNQRFWTGQAAWGRSNRAGSAAWCCRSWGSETRRVALLLAPLPSRPATIVWTLLASMSTSLPIYIVHNVSFIFFFFLRKTKIQFQWYLFTFFPIVIESNYLELYLQIDEHQ